MSQIYSSLWTGRLEVSTRFEGLLILTLVLIWQSLNFVSSGLLQPSLQWHHSKEPGQTTKLQNKCAWLVNIQLRSCYITPLLMELHWFRVSEPIIFKTLLYVYKSLNGLCPQYMNDCLVVNRPRLGSVTTRSGHGLNEPRCSKDTEVCWGQSLFSGCSTIVE